MLLTTLVVGETAPSTTLGTMIVVSGAFLILMLLLKKYAWGAIVDILTQREEKLPTIQTLQNNLAQQQRKWKKNVNNNYFLPDQKQLKLLKRERKWRTDSPKTLKETTAEVTRLREKARTDISQEREEALSSVKNEVADLSLQIAAKILNKELTPDAHEALIDSYIESLGKANETR